MIAVVFEPRFGSSKVMQALADSGYPVHGEKFPAWIKEDDHKWNPLGFYETANTLLALSSGVGAVKVRTGEIGHCPEGTRFVLCLRDVKDATASQMRSGMVPWHDEAAGIRHNADRYYLADKLLTGKDVLRIDHAKWLANPEAEKARLLRWVHGV